MRYARIVETLIAKRWMITPEMHQALCGLVKSKLGEAFGAKIDAAQPGMADRGKNVFADYGAGQEIQSMEVRDGIAFIPVVGVLANKISMVEKSCGVTDYRDIQNDLEEVYNDARITAAVLMIDSPGGTVTGCYETADAVARLVSKKPVVAFTDGMICSAAYYMAAPCTSIDATPSAVIGSIGCMLQLLDDTKAWEMFGYKVETFRSDDMKAIGASGTSLSDQQRAYLQELVDEGANRFKNWVSHHRGIDRGTAMDGRVFSADRAIEEGLADRLVGSITDAISLLK